MKAKLIKFLILAYISFTAGISTQGQGHADRVPPQQFTRPSTFELVDEVRNAIGLDSKEFDKVYAAYEKYNMSVFGNESGNMKQPFRPEGGPGRNPGGRPGGMGGLGGMPSQGGGMGVPGGDFRGQRQHSERPGDKAKAIDFEKLEKTKTKAEEKLCKTMKKIFKNEPSKYDMWLSVRQQQLKTMFRPQPPQGMKANDSNK